MDAVAKTRRRARLFGVLQHLHLQRVKSRAEESEESEDEVGCKRRRQAAPAAAAVAAAVMCAPTPTDTRDADEVLEDLRRGVMYGQTLKKARKLIPGIGRGNSEANDLASRARHTLRYPTVDGGVYEAKTSSEIRYMTGMDKQEFDDFYDDTMRDGQGNVLVRSWFFQEARNNLGRHDAVFNKTRRTIRGGMDDKSRVLCFLEMLRRDVQFEDMSQKYGRSAGTWHNDFKDMTTAAQDMPCLQNEIRWPDAAEREAHANFLQRYGHPDLPRVTYIADGTMVGMRNPSRIGKGKEEPHDAVHAANYSGNKGLGTSHIVYCNIRGKILRIETVRGGLSDRGAHTSSRVFLYPQEFLSPGEVGMGDGNYRGTARSDSNVLQMCVPYQKPSVGQMPTAARRFNSEQRRFRVVVENTIGQIKKYKTVGNGKAFRHKRDIEKDVFNVCARLTARIMRVRNAYPRSEEWVGDKKEEWEAKLGIHYYWDHDEPGSYFIHGIGEDYVYQNTTDGMAADLQARWEDIWGV